MITSADGTQGASSWPGLSLSPEDQERAARAIAGIATEVLDSPVGEPSLAGGASGLALLFAYLAEAEGSDSHAERAVRLAEDAMAMAVATLQETGLYGGLVGPAWVLAHLDGWWVDLFGGDPNDAVDGAVLDVLSAPSWPQAYDLISGLVGLGVYALERLPRLAAARALKRIVGHLEEMSEPGAGGISWHTRPGLLPDYQRAQAPQGYYNLGVAHGVPGVIGLLASICEAGVATPRAAELLAGAVEWVLAQQAPEGGFPPWVGPGTVPRRSRSAWCYGEPGVSAMLLRAATASGRSDWADRAVRSALHAAERTGEESGVTEAGLCHGAAGLAHIYNRLWHQTQDERLHAEACRWVTRTLDLLGSTAKPELLEGRAGVALALLAATGTEPCWDRILLLSAPSGR